MNSGQTVFRAADGVFTRRQFHACVARYDGDRRVHTFSCSDQFLCMAFAQLTYRERLRDIETCLRALRSKLYHASIRGTISRSTLADANEQRDWRIYADFAAVLIKRARELYGLDDFGVALQQTAYAFDSTTIDLSLKLFPRAYCRRQNSAILIYTGRVPIWMPPS